MRLIQLILIPIVIVLAALYLTRVRSRLFGRIVVILIGLLGSALIISPDLAQQLAERVGVGRGTDLVLYLGLCGMGFINLLLFSKARNLEDQLTELVRKVTLNRAEGPGEGSSS